MPVDAAVLTGGGVAALGAGAFGAAEPIDAAACCLTTRSKASRSLRSLAFGIALGAAGAAAGLTGAGAATLGAAVVDAIGAGGAEATGGVDGPELKPILAARASRRAFASASAFALASISSSGGLNPAGAEAAGAAAENPER